MALDLISAQPLQEMELVGERVVSNLEMGTTSGKDCLMEEIIQQARTGDNTPPGVLPSELDEEFPPLSKEGLRDAKEKERNRGGGGREAGGTLEQQPKRKMDKYKEGLTGNLNSKGESNRWAGGKNYRESLVDGGKLRANSPISFEPGKIKKLGVQGESNGLPSIQFSGEETAYLAEQLGYAVVGKFSHSIPSSFHLQRAFQGMKFLGEYSWKYINAKHVLV